jgi:hypothetical protein
MQNMNAALISIGILSVIVYLWSTIMIYSFLKDKDKDEKLQSFILINLFIFKYINDYKTITKNENGKTGYLYYLWLISINTALLCFILLMIIK